MALRQEVDAFAGWWRGSPKSPWLLLVSSSARDHCWQLLRSAMPQERCRHAAIVVLPGGANPTSRSPTLEENMTISAEPSARQPAAWCG
jgi:hypothetical protein